jgi:transcriptional regulator with XRE-family HTH domain
MDLENLIRWINQQLNDQNLSIRKLAERMGMSNSHISQILSGRAEPGIKFYLKVAEAFNERPEKIFRLAGILPATGDEDEATIAEIATMLQDLPPSERREVLDYARYRRERYRRGEE